MPRNTKNPRPDKLMSPQKVNTICKNLAPGTVIQLKWRDSGKCYVEIDDIRGLSIIRMVGYFMKHDNNTVFLTSDWDITEEEPHGAMNLVSDYDIYELCIVKLPA